MKACLHVDEEQRLAALHSYDILDTPRESPFDEVVELIGKICQTPVAVINFIDEGRQWFKAEVGLGLRETPLDISICAHAILQSDLLVVPDTLEDVRFRDNPLCVGEPHLRFYAGALLKTKNGLPLGTLCVLDYKPRQLSDVQRLTLQVLARQTMAQLELRRLLLLAETQVQEADHRVKNSLQLVNAFLHLQSRSAKSQEARTLLAVASDRIGAVASLHEHLHRSTSHAEVDLADFFGLLVTNLKRTAPREVALELEAAPVLVDTGSASTVGLLLNELVANALQHAFSEGDGGRVCIGLNRKDGAVKIEVRDNGRGVPPGFSFASSRGLGSQIISNLVESLGGQIDLARLEPGTWVQLSFPANRSKKGEMDT